MLNISYFPLLMKVNSYTFTEMCLDSVFYTNAFCAFLYFWAMPGGVPGSALGISPGGLEGTMWVVGGSNPRSRGKMQGKASGLFAVL